MRIITTPVLGKELKPGELFSTAGPEYWDTCFGKGAVGERVYIRTPDPCPPGTEDEQVFRIEIEA